MIHSKHYEELFQLIRRRYPEDTREKAAELATHLCREHKVTRDRWGRLEVHVSARPYAGRLFDEQETHAVPDNDEDRLALITKLFDRTAAKIGNIPEAPFEGTRLERAAEHRRRGHELLDRGDRLDAYSEFVKASALETAVRAEEGAASYAATLAQSEAESRVGVDERRAAKDAVQDMHTTAHERSVDANTASTARRTEVERRQGMHTNPMKSDEEIFGLPRGSQ